MLRREIATSLLMQGGGAAPAVASPDAAFNFLPFNIYKAGDNMFNVGAWDISAQIPRTVERYVSKSGNDSTGNGLSWATAWKTMSKAFTVLAAVENAAVYVGAGRYGYSDGSTQQAAWPNGRSLIGVGNVAFDAYWACAFSLTSGKTYTFQASITGQTIPAVLDYGTLDANDDPTSYSKQTSVDAVEATVGSFYYDTTGHILYVHTLDEVTPDADVRPQYLGDVSINVYLNNKNIYMENIRTYVSKFRCDTNAAGNTGIIYLKNCRFMHQTTSININGYTSYFQNCQLAHAPLNLIVGYAQNTNEAKIVLIDTDGWDCGPVTVGGHTVCNHNSGTTVIINGEHYDASGIIIATNGTTKTWLLGTNIHDSSAPDFGEATLDICYGDSGGEAWLDSCTLSGCYYDIEAYASVCHIRNLTSDGIHRLVNGGSVVAY